MASAYAIAVIFVAVVASLLLCSIHVDAGEKWNDPSNCGRWHYKCPCQPPKRNTKPTCVNGKCGFVCSKSQWRDCNNDINAAKGNGCETNVDCDPVNCGGCGIKCPAPANSTPRCLKGGRCSFQCNKGFKLQIDNTCVPATTTCGSGCKSPGPNTDSVCQGGKCEPVCHHGFQDCDADAAGICEANVKEDVTNCGSCNRRCPQSSVKELNDLATCSNGTCGLVCGYPNRANCDGDAANGCETDLLNAVSHCGTCGKACAEPPNTTGAACLSGSCGYRDCSEGFADCDEDPSNGCETDISPTVENGCLGSGSCFKDNRPCPVPPNTVAAKCKGVKSCSYTECLPGFMDCDGEVSNGCETHISPTVENGCSGSGSCPGAHNPPCPVPPNTVAAKCKGENSCSYTECLPGFMDCDGEVSNGCEVDTTADDWNHWSKRDYCGICKMNEYCNDFRSEDCSSVCTVEPYTAYCTREYSGRPLPGMTDDEGFCYLT